MLCQIVRRLRFARQKRPTRRSRPDLQTFPWVRYHNQNAHTGADSSASGRGCYVRSYGYCDSRAKSALLGAHDLISNPFLGFDITIKTLTLVLTARLQAEDAMSDRTGTAIRAPKAPYSALTT